jgi:formimidoylglutamate deiminase
MVSSNELFSLGVAAHSLRAVKEEDLDKISDINNGPIHIHVAEQVQEVEEVKKFYGKRPVEWLIENFDINERWCFIHCTQMTKSETLDLAKSGAVAGLCPVTEANLGDGIFNGLEYFQNQGMFGLGTDSNINISLIEEIKTFEYSQRLINKKRAVISNQKKSSGRIIFDQSLAGGSRALQINNGKIENGYCADLLSLRIDNLELDGLVGDKILDYFIFASKGNLINRVWKKGKCLVNDGKHIDCELISSKYQKTIRKLKNLL